LRTRFSPFLLEFLWLSVANVSPALAASSKETGQCMSPAEAKALEKQLTERFDRAEKEFSRAFERFEKAQEAAGRAMRGPGEQPREAGPWYRHLHQEEEAAGDDLTRSTDEATFLQHMRDVFHGMDEGE
jgi:hypothetical protein